MEPEKRTGYGRILRTTSVMGGASVLRIAIGIVRTKTLAIMLGPAGIGLLGLLTSIMNTVATLVSCGLQNSGVREISNAKGDESQAWHVRKAVWALGIGLGMIGTLTTWFLREPISRLILGSHAEPINLGWIAIGVLFTVVGTAPIVILQGNRRIKAIAQLQIVGALLGSIVSVIVIVAWGAKAIALCVIVMPLGIVVCATFLERRNPHPLEVLDLGVREIAGHAKKILGFGFLLMAGGLVSSAVDLVVRGLVTEELGIEAAGHFHAALQLSTLYLSLVLAAMSTDYYPRLVEALGNDEDTSQVISEQTEIAILLAGPVILAAIALAPWIVRVLYAADFAPAAQVFRWQVLADVIKIMTWPLGFLFIARRQGLVFLGIEVVTFGFYVALNAVAIPRIGLEGAGMAFFAMYLLHLPLMSFLGWRAIGFKWSPRIAVGGARLLISAGALLGLTYVSQTAAAIVGLVLCCFFGALSLRRLDEMSIGGRIGSGIAALRKITRI